MLLTVLLDTGPLYAVANSRDQHHAAALALFGQLPRNVRPFVSSSVVLELHRLILYRSNDPRLALRVIDQLSHAYKVMHPLEGDYEAARIHLGRFPDQTITLADAVLAGMTKRLGAQVMTFDERHFGLMGVQIFGAPKA